MPIVFDNIVFNLQRSGGISRYWSKIIQPYIGGDDDCVFIEREGCESNIYRQDIAVAPIVRDHRLPTKAARYVNFSRRFFDDPFLFHSSYFRTNRAHGCINITTVHDLIYEKFSKGLGSALHLRQKTAALRKSDCIVCVSEYTRKDLFEYYPFCIDKRVVVIPNGVDFFYKTNSNSELRVDFRIIERPESYFLYVGHRGGCKGFNLVYDALDMLDDALCCMVVGDYFSKSEMAEIRARGYEDKITNFGKVSDAELNDLYSQAKFFFFPSFYEGFGIPPLEAMAAYCPVLASNQSSVPEVVGDAGVLFDPFDRSSLKTGISRILQIDVREKVIELGIERAYQFSWGSVIEKYAQLYSELLSH